MGNSLHKGVYQLNYADNLTTEKAWNVAMVICVIQVRRERLIKIEALITVWMRCSVHKTLFSLTSRSVVLEPSGNNNFHNKAQSALWLVEKARMLYESLKDGAKAVTPCQYSLFYVSYSPYTSFVPLPERFTTEQSTIKASLFVKCSDGRF